MHKASRNRSPNKAEAKSAAVDCAELPHTPLIVHVIAKMIDHPFMFSFSREKQSVSALFPSRQAASSQRIPHVDLSLISWQAMQYFAHGNAARRFGLMGPSQFAQVP